jgi:polysaccharide biosynthesis transport protein
MNNERNVFPGGGSVVSIDARGGLPSTGLRDVVVSGSASGESRVSLSEIWRVLAKWWWLIAVMTVICLLASVVLSLLVQPEYRAKTTVEANREGVQVVQMGQVDAMQMGDREFLTTQAGLMRSRALAERVARSLNIANNADYVRQDQDRAVREAQAASLVGGSIQVAPLRDSRLIELTVEGTDPNLVARIANAYTENFIQSNLERRFEATSYARNFLEQRLATIKGRLEESERQLVAYAQRQGIVSLNVDSGSGQGGRSEQSLDATSLIALNNSLSQARAERIAAEQRYRQAQSRATTEMISDPTIQTLTTQRAQLQAEYQEKLGIFQPDYPTMVQMRSRIEAIDQAIRQARSNVGGALQSEFAAAVAREGQLQARVDQLKNALLNLRERSIQYTILQREVDTNRALYDALLQRYKEVGVGSGVGTNVISVVDPAQVPTAPFKPNLPFNIVVGLVAGLLLGTGAAFALEWMDDTIKTPDDLTGKLGIASLGVIPKAERESSLQDQLSDSRSQVAEAYQSVRTALQFSTDHGVPKSLLITSTRAGEGKSSSALAIAQILANLGASVLLIDGDLRKPTFRAPGGAGKGLSSLLAGSDEVSEAIHPTEHPRLALLPAGQIPPNPAELLASDRFPAILEQVGQMFDHIVVDGPPVLGLADAPLLSYYCEGTLMMIEAGAIRRAAAINSVKRLRAADARLMGGVLTKFSATKSGYGYGYGYGYGDDQYTYRQGEQAKPQIELTKKAS